MPETQSLTCLYAKITPVTQPPMFWKWGHARLYHWVAQKGPVATVKARWEQNSLLEKEAQEGTILRKHQAQFANLTLFACEKSIFSSIRIIRDTI